MTTIINIKQRLTTVTRTTLMMMWTQYRPAWPVFWAPSAWRYARGPVRRDCCRWRNAAAALWLALPWTTSACASLWAWGCHLNNTPVDSQITRDLITHHLSHTSLQTYVTLIKHHWWAHVTLRTITLITGHFKRTSLQARVTSSRVTSVTRQFIRRYFNHTISITHHFNHSPLKSVCHTPFQPHVTLVTRHFSHMSLLSPTTSIRHHFNHLSL